MGTGNGWCVFAIMHGDVTDKEYSIKHTSGSGGSVGTGVCVGGGGGGWLFRSVSVSCTDLMAGRVSASEVSTSDSGVHKLSLCKLHMCMCGYSAVTFPYLFNHWKHK